MNLFFCIEPQDLMNLVPFSRTPFLRRLPSSHRGGRILSTALVLIAVFFGPLDAQAQVDREDAVDRSVIPEDLRTTYSAYKAALGQSADDAVAYYAPNAVVMVNSNLIFHGRAEIKADFLEQFLRAQSANQPTQGEPVTPLA